MDHSRRHSRLRHPRNAAARALAAVMRIGWIGLAVVIVCIIVLIVL
ncbi:hypothetical protein OG874_00590 [Nocardia sp. NBC_00565]|nr:hypothetical protein [Nocardia sp. NBC_00565]WUC03753.1 hypothetical protein OG874_00590 [Nocardia sp. NBC_00565]